LLFMHVLKILTFQNFCPALCAAQPHLADTEADTGEALVPAAPCPHSGVYVWICIYINPKP
jgi:hypothetical protein